MAAKSRVKQKQPSRGRLDLQIKVLQKSVASLEWGCAYAFPVKREVAIPLVVVSELYRSPQAPR